MINGVQWCRNLGQIKNAPSTDSIVTAIQSEPSRESVGSPPFQQATSAYPARYQQNHNVQHSSLPCFMLWLGQSSSLSDSSGSEEQRVLATRAQPVTLAVGCCCFIALRAGGIRIVHALFKSQACGTVIKSPEQCAVS
jgi:hypothetical protein